MIIEVMTIGRLVLNINNNMPQSETIMYSLCVIKQYHGMKKEKHVR